MKYQTALILSIVWTLATFTAPLTAGSMPSPSLSELLLKCEQSYREIGEYTCRMHRTELINGKYKVQRNVIVKYRKPGSFYLKWTEGQGKGSESLYVIGQNGDRMLVHLPGLYKFFVFSMPPRSKRALKTNRHSIDQVHFGFFIDMIRNNLEMAGKDPKAVIAMEGEEMVDGLPALVFTGIFPPEGRYYGCKVRVSISTQHFLPVKIVVYGQNDLMLESYQFTDIKLNPGLSDQDFSANNDNYGFKGRKTYALE